MERLTKGDAPKAIAAKIGVDPSQVSRWRSGKSEPSAENASRLAEAYGGDRFEALAAAGRVEPQTTADILQELNDITPERVAEASALERELGIQYPAGVLDAASQLWDLIARLSREAMENGAGPDLQHAIQRAMEVASDVLPAMVLNSPDAPQSGDFIKQLATTSMKITEGLDHADSSSDSTKPDAQAQGGQAQEDVPGVGPGVVKPIRPSHWDQSPPPPTFEEADAASQGYKQSDDERDDTE